MRFAAKWVNLLDYETNSFMKTFFKKNQTTHFLVLYLNLFLKTSTFTNIEKKLADFFQELQ